MARTTVDTNGILPCQEAFLVDAPTPQASPHRWIQAKGSHIEKILDERGEGIVGVVWAVADADASKSAAQELGVSTYYTLDYSQSQIDRDLQGRFSRYYEHFMSGPLTPLGNASVLIGEFDLPRD